MKTPLQTLRGLAIATLALAAFALPAHADTAAISAWDTIGGTSINAGWTLGWKFLINGTVANSVWMTSLGVYDAAGLTASSTVSIWDEDKNLIASVAIPASGGTDLNSFRYVSLPSWVQLTSGQVYTIGVTSTQDFSVPYVNQEIGQNIYSTPEVVLYGGVTGIDTSYPDDATSSTRYAVSANFQYSLIPEPSTYALIGSGVLALRLLRRKKIAMAA